MVDLITTYCRYPTDFVVKSTGNAPYRQTTITLCVNNTEAISNLIATTKMKYESYMVKSVPFIVLANPVIVKINQELVCISLFNSIFSHEVTELLDIRSAVYTSQLDFSPIVSIGFHSCNIAEDQIQFNLFQSKGTEMFYSKIIIYQLKPAPFDTDCLDYLKLDLISRSFCENSCACDLKQISVNQIYIPVWFTVTQKIIESENKTFYKYFNYTSYAIDAEAMKNLKSRNVTLMCKRKCKSDCHSQL